MNKKSLILSVVLAVVAIGAVFLGMSFPQGNTQSEGTGILTTQDIGARITGDAELKAASFVPNLSDADAIIKAQEIVRIGMHLSDPEKLPAKVTVAQFSGKREVAPFDSVEDLPVRVVVFDDYPATPRGRIAQDQFEKPRYTVVLDDETGELVYSILSWGHKEAP